MFAEEAKAKRFQFAFQNLGDAQDLTQTAKEKGRGSSELQAICIGTLGSLVFLSHQIHGTPDGSSGKEHTCQCKRYRRCSFDPWVGKIPLEKAMAIHFSILAWGIPWTEEPGRLQSIGSQRVRHG